MPYEKLKHKLTCFPTGQALTHPYFTSAPAPTHHSKLPKPKEELKPRALVQDASQIQETKKRKGNEEEAAAAKGAPPGGSENSDMPPKPKVARKLDFT